MKSWGDRFVRESGADEPDHHVRRAGPQWPQQGAPRFKLLELLRERARELLDGDEPTVLADRHAQYVAVFLEDLDQRRWSDASDLWIDLIMELLAEIRAAHPVTSAGR